MKTFKFILANIAIIALAGLPVLAFSQHPFRMSEDQVKDLLQGIEQKTDRFRESLDTALDRSRIDDTMAEDNINRFVKNFEEATDRLKDRYGDERTAAASVETVLEHASAIDVFMWQNDLTPRAQNDWRSLCTNLDQLAYTYHVSWGWLGLNNRPHRVSKKQMETLLARIETNADRFRKSLDDALDKTHFNSTDVEDDINKSIKDFEESTDRLKDRFDDDNAAVATVHEILRRSARIDVFMRQHKLTLPAHEDWRKLRSSLDQLAQAYRFSWRWY